MMMRDQISILADNVEAALQQGIQIGAGQGRIEGRLSTNLRPAFCSGLDFMEW